MKSTPHADQQLFDLAKELYFARMMKPVPKDYDPKRNYQMDIAQVCIDDAQAFMRVAIRYFVKANAESPQEG